MKAVITKFQSAHNYRLKQGQLEWHSVECMPPPRPNIPLILRFLEPPLSPCKRKTLQRYLPASSALNRYFKFDASLFPPTELSVCLCFFVCAIFCENRRVAMWEHNNTDRRACTSIRCWCAADRQHLGNVTCSMVGWSRLLKWSKWQPRVD